jgi:hypothetical protein
MAIPSAPPSSRVVSFTAEPTPALASGTALMMLPVAGAAVMLMPTASSPSATASATYGDDTPTTLSTPNPAAMNTKPSAIVRPLPIRAASAALRGAMAIIVSANGSVATPVSSAEYPLPNCRYWLNRKKKPNMATTSPTSGPT